MIGGSLQWGLSDVGSRPRETRPGQQRLDAVIAARRAVSTGRGDRPKHWWSDMWPDKVCRGAEAVLTSTRFKLVTGSIDAS
jgi:hypothetical protein